MSSPQFGSAATNLADEVVRLREENKRLLSENGNLNQELRQLENQYTRILIEGNQKEQKARPMQLLHNAQDGIFFSNAKGDIIFINPYLSTILGLGSEEKKLVGKPMPSEVWEDRSELSTINQDLATYGQIRDRLVIMRNLHSGERVYVSLSSVAVRDPYGKMIGAQHVLCNITSKMRITEELRVRNEFLSVLTSLIASRQSSDDLNALMTDVLTQLLAVLDTPAQGAIYLKGDSEGQLNEVVRLYHDTTDEMSDERLREVAAQAVASGQSVAHQHTPSEKVGSITAAPLLADAPAMGAVVFEAANNRIYTEIEREMLGIVALGLGWTVKYLQLNHGVAI